MDLTCSVVPCCFTTSRPHHSGADRWALEAAVHIETRDSFTDTGEGKSVYCSSHVSSSTSSSTCITSGDCGSGRSSRRSSGRSSGWSCSGRRSRRTLGTWQGQQWRQQQWQQQQWAAAAQFTARVCDTMQQTLNVHFGMVLTVCHGSVMLYLVMCTLQHTLVGVGPFNIPVRHSHTHVDVFHCLLMIYGPCTVYLWGVDVLVQNCNTDTHIRVLSVGNCAPCSAHSWV
jgi:hypothetical protein